MKKLTKRFVIAGLMFLLSVSTVFAASGSAVLSGGGLGAYNTGWWVTRGDYISVAISGGTKQKRAYGRMGAEGSYSVWTSDYYVDVVDYGPFGAIGAGNWSYQWYVR